MPEIDTVLNFLRLIDNPYQDIPLLSVLHSPLYGISADALTEIRLFGGDGLFYECVLRYLAEGVEEEILENWNASKGTCWIGGKWQKNCPFVNCCGISISRRDITIMRV